MDFEIGLEFLKTHIPHWGGGGGGVGGECF